MARRTLSNRISGRLEEKVTLKYLRAVTRRGRLIEDEVQKATQRFYPEMNIRVLGKQSQPSVVSTYQNESWKPLQKETLRRKSKYGRPEPSYYYGPSRMKQGLDDKRHLKAHIKDLRNPGNKFKKIGGGRPQVYLRVQGFDYDLDTAERYLSQIAEKVGVRARTDRLIIETFGGLTADKFGERQSAKALHGERFFHRIYQPKRPFRRAYFLWFVNEFIPRKIKDT